MDKWANHASDTESIVLAFRLISGCQKFKFLDFDIIYARHWVTKGRSATRYSMSGHP
jgi:hypothetical protein